MKLYYDERDHQYCREHGDNRLYWLDDLEACPITEATPADPGYLFAGARPIEDYRALVAGLPGLLDLPQDREPLLRLDTVLLAVDSVRPRLAIPRTWSIPVDAPIPAGVSFPAFVRTVDTSWKLGGSISRVSSPAELQDECESLRRAFGWDATILVREWLDLAPAGDTAYGPLPQEVRVWILDQAPVAWSFHHLHLVPEPTGFPPSSADLAAIESMARAVGSCFAAMLVVADFARTTSGDWVFLEAGPGSCAGTAHEQVFKAVASALAGRPAGLPPDRHGGPLGALEV